MKPCSRQFKKLGILLSLPDIAWGNHSRVVLDVGCGVASFGGYQFDKDVVTMSFAPKDEHEAQVQFALERGIPAVLAVMGTKRLPFPGMVFDVIHCARCRVPWHIEGGMLLLELNRLLRPGGFFVWSATPVYRKTEEDIGIWKVFAAALRDLMVWVMNVAPIDSPDTLPIIYERGLFGMYHDWCESFSTYPRTYDLLNADHFFSRLKIRCNLLPVIVEVDRPNTETSRDSDC